MTGDFVQQQIKLHSAFTRDELTARGIMGYLYVKFDEKLLKNHH